jgi:hypothetical protein
MALTLGPVLSSPPLPGGGGAARSVAALQAQLAQYQKQLSDCVNCASSSTREGQAQIQALSSKIAAVRGQINAAAAAQQASQAPQRQLQPTAVTDAGSSQAYPGRQGPSAPGRLLDVYA